MKKSAISQVLKQYNEEYFSIFIFYIPAVLFVTLMDLIDKLYKANQKCHIAKNSILVKLTAAQLLTNFPNFMKPKFSLISSVPPPPHTHTHCATP
jgi:hypothetical protein